MQDLNNYMQDWANYQSRAVLAHLQWCWNIEESWNSEYKKYNATINVARWENCREQWYIVSLYTQSKQLNIIFYEHRNSDMINAIKWEQTDINSINISTIKKWVFEDKYDSSFQVSYWEYAKMWDWIFETLKQFWIFNNLDK